jgi:tripartite-type tricarboxylate transporter receptor subunit TctC
MRQANASILELTQDARRRAVPEILATIPAIGVTIMGPPDMPADRVDLLRKAADRMTADPDFRAQMKALELVVDPMSGADTSKLVMKASSADQETVRAVLGYTAPIP